jgi:hypothetical protein
MKYLVSLAVIMSFAFISNACTDAPVEHWDISTKWWRVEICWESVDDAVSYEIFHASSRLGRRSQLVRTTKNRYTHFPQDIKNRYQNYYFIVPKDEDGRNIVFLEWERVGNAASYQILRSTSDDFELIEEIQNVESVDKPPFTFLRYKDNVRNFDRNKPTYRIIAKNADGATVRTINDVHIDKITERVISFENKIFGDNVMFFDPAFDTMDAIKADVKRISDKMHNMEFGASRYTQYFKPGKYSDFDEHEIGFYTLFAGLGKTPSQTQFYGSIRTRPHIGNSGGFQNNSTCTFWRAVENFEVNAADNHDTRFQWAVSQAAPARRLSINVPSYYLRHDYTSRQGSTIYGWGSGGFIADSYFSSTMELGGQQQWYTRNSHFEHSAPSGVSWNKVTQGSTGETHPTNWAEGGSATWIEKTPIIREKPFLYIEDGVYKVFKPALRQNAAGVSWSEDEIGEGQSFDLLSEFYIAKPSDDADKINAELQSGKHLLLTPGWYFLDKPIHVTRENTIVLGIGYATLVPSENNRFGAILVEDVSGVTVAGVMLDALYNSTYLIRIGESGCNKDHSANPTVLSDVIIRVGGFKTENVHAQVAAQINSNNVIGDHLWIWRADHGSGVGWNRNTSPYGLIVSGDNVTMYGLFVEHFQKYETLWLGENGRTFFYQNESPYDPTNQDVYMSHGGAVRGWASYKVANQVNNHYAIGLGCYSVFNRTGENRSQSESVFMDNAIEVPNKPNVWIHHVVITELAGSYSTEPFRALVGTNSIVNGTGEAVDNRNVARASRLVSYNNAIAVLPNNSEKTAGIQPADEIFDIPDGGSPF